MSTTCNAGFSLHEGQCLACVPPQASVCGNGKAPATAAIICPAGNSDKYNPSIDDSGPDCITCADGKFTPTSGNGCTACRENAATCTSLTNDSTCNAGFSLESGTCTACELPAASVCGNGKEPTNAMTVCYP